MSASPIGRHSESRMTPDLRPNLSRVSRRHQATGSSALTAGQVKRQVTPEGA